MENNTRGLLGVSSGGSTTGCMSTVSEASSSYQHDSELELGLSLGTGGGGGSLKESKAAAPWGQYARILTAKDFPSFISKSSSSSSSLTKANDPNNISSSAGTKRIAADSVSPPTGTTSQVVGWPPIRAYRMNSLVNQAKLQITEELGSVDKEHKGKNAVVNNDNNTCNKHNSDGKETRLLKTSLFVKVNIDGTPIGRKVDLNAYSCYETLAQTLEEMFFTPNTTNTRRSGMDKHKVMAEAAGPSKLLDGSSEFVLTYEDKEGDWMLVGDVPWRMFPSSVKRLRITRTSEANGLAPRSGERRTGAI